MLKKIIVFFLIFNIYSCANYSRTAIDKLTGKSGAVKIVAVKPSIELFEVNAVGGQMLKAEWTTSAINNVEVAMKDYFRDKNINVDFYLEDLTDNQIEYIKLQKVVSSIIQAHVVNPDRKLPTKEKEGLDWTVGSNFQNEFKNLNADYILILNIKDYFSTGGRILAQTLRALIIGSYAPLIQQGYGTLIDVNTGDFVWFDFVQAESFGDTRNKEGAEDAVEKILKNLPKS